MVIAEAPVDPSTWFQYFISLVMLTLFYFLSRGERIRRREVRKVQEEEIENEEEEDEDFYEPSHSETPYPIPQVLKSKRDEVEDTLRSEMEALYGPANFKDIESAYENWEGDGISKGKKMIKSFNSLSSLVIAKEILDKPRANHPYDV